MTQKEIKAAESRAHSPEIVKAIVVDTGWPLDGHEVYLARWDYDPEHWHLFNWEMEADEAVMLTIFQTEMEAGLCAYESLEDFAAVWTAGKYETNCALLVGRENVEIVRE